MEVLLAILQGRCDELSFDGAILDEMLGLAEEEHLLSLVVQRCLALPGASSAALRKLKTAEREAAIAAFYWISELRRVLQGFSRCDLMVVLLKGPSLAQRLYGDAALRTSYDLDLLVPKEQLTRAEDALRTLGSRRVRRTTITVSGSEDLLRWNCTMT